MSSVHGGRTCLPGTELGAIEEDCPRYNLAATVDSTTQMGSGAEPQSGLFLRMGGLMASSLENRQPGSEQQ